MRAISGVSPLTSWNDYNPAFSPDGCTIVYQAGPHEDGHTQIFIMSIDGTAAVNVTSDPKGTFGAPAWSPDGAWIAMRADPESDGSTQVWLMRSAGSELRRLTPM